MPSSAEGSQPVSGGRDDMGGAESGGLTIVGLSIRDPLGSQQTLNDLYLEALYTIVHRVGKAPSIPDAVLIRYVQNAFQIGEVSHQIFMDKARREKPPIVLLNVQLIEAKDLIAKDVNGFSDPFCMMGVIPGRRRKAPIPPSAMENGKTPASGFVLDDYDERDTPPISPSTHNPTHRNSGGSNVLQRFGGSFRRKFESRGSRRSGKGIETGIPAKLIKASSVQLKTLNPKWNEKFQFIVDDVGSDKFHLDIWDHDDEERSVLDAAASLNQIQGLKGLGRYFKEVTQSARAGSNELVDDFLGSVTLKIKEIPSSGLEEWFPLERRSDKSEVSGSVLLKLSLSTKEERFDGSGNGVDNAARQEDDLLDVKQHIELIRQFALQEIRASGAPVSQFQGNLPEAAVTILHQHAIQGDLTEIHQAMCQWLAYAVMINIGISYAFLYDILSGLISKWRTLALDKEEENMLASSFEAFNTSCRNAIMGHRENISLGKSTESFANMIRCLKLLRESNLYEKCVPFGKTFIADMTDIIMESATNYFKQLQQDIEYEQQTKGKTLSSCEELYTLVEGLNRANAKIAQFDPVFKSCAGVDYHTPTYTEFDRLLFEYISSEMMSEKKTDLKSMLLNVPSEDESMLITILKLHFALNEFARFRKPKQRYKMESIDWSTTFDRAISKWLDLARVRAFARVELAFQLDAQIQITSNEIRHTSSYVDVCHIIEQFMVTWEHSHVKDVSLRAELTEKLVVQNICKIAEYFLDRAMTQLAADGFCGQLQPYLPPALVNIFCSAINNCEQVRRSLAAVGEKLHLDELSELYERKTKHFQKEAAWRLNVEKELDHCEKYIAEQIDMTVDRMVRRQMAQLKKHVFHLAWSPSACPLEQSLKPLTDMLDSELSLVHRTLLHRNFVRVMYSQVHCLLYLFKECVNENPGLEPNFYQRLSEAWTILSEFFHAEGKGISLEAFESIPAHKSLVSQLSLNQMTTLKLIELYYRELLKEQNEVTECKYGILNIRAYYNAGSQTLVLDVIGAKQIIPLDSNGLSDPFVVIELVPRIRYMSQPIVKTKIVPKTLNPIFDETFEFHISPKIPPTALCHFVVMDHDFLRSNDFAGEAFLDLAEIPGFGQAGVSTTLRQFNLILIHPSRKAQESSIAVLDSRKEDKDAQEFVRTLNINY